MLLIGRIYPPVFGTTKRPPRCPKRAAVLSSLLVEIEDRFWMYAALFLACIVPKARLLPWGNVPACAFPWNSALSVTPRDTMKELWTLTLMSGRGLKREDSVISSLSMGSCRQMGPLYVLLPISSGCSDGFSSSEFPGDRAHGSSWPQWWLQPDTSVWALHPCLSHLFFPSSVTKVMLKHRGNDAIDLTGTWSLVFPHFRQLQSAWIQERTSCLFWIQVCAHAFLLSFLYKKENPLGENTCSHFSVSCLVYKCSCLKPPQTKNTK